MLDGDSAEKVWGALIVGAAKGAAVVALPDMAVVFTTVDQIDKFFDCLYMGYTAEEILAVMAINGFTEFGPAKTGDKATDAFVEGVFGAGRDFARFGGEKLVEGKDRTPPDSAKVTQAIIGVLATGVGCKCSMINFDRIGSVDLWKNP